MPKVWISKYALTNGIEEIDIREVGDGMVATLGPYTNYYLPGQWHETREAAVARAEVMRVAKLKSLRKSISEIEGMVF